MVHDLLGLKQGAAKDEADNFILTYDLVEIVNYNGSAPIVELDSGMTIDADLLIEQGCVLVVPEGVTLSFTNNNRSVVNNGEIQVNGMLDRGNATITGTGEI